MPGLRSLEKHLSAKDKYKKLIFQNYTLRNNAALDGEITVANISIIIYFLI